MSGLKSKLHNDLIYSLYILEIILMGQLWLHSKNTWMYFLDKY